MVDFYPAEVVASLLTLRDHQALNQDPQTVTLVRVQRDAFARELAKVQSISCPYCREWAAYVYKQFYLPTTTAAGSGGSRGEQRGSEVRRRKAGGGRGAATSGETTEVVASDDYGDAALTKGKTNVFLQQVWEAAAFFPKVDHAAKAFSAFTAGNTEMLLTLLQAVFTEADPNAAGAESTPGAVASAPVLAGGETNSEKSDENSKHNDQNSICYLDSVLSLINRWVSLPPQNAVMPNFAGPVVVSPHDGNGPNDEDWHMYPLEVLDAANWDDRSFLTLSINDILPLRSLPRDLLEDQFLSGGACHPRGKWKTPAEEKVAREAVSGEIERLGRDAQNEMDKAVVGVWKPLRDTLTVVREQLVAREAVLGHASIEKLMKAFEEKHAEAFVGFSLHEKYKKSGKGKGKGKAQEVDVGDLDNEFTSFLHRLDNVNAALLEELLFPLASEVMNIVERSGSSLLTAAEEAKVRLSAMTTVSTKTKRSFDHLFNIIHESFSSLVILTTKQIDQLESDLLAKAAEQADEMDSIIAAFLHETQPITSGRLEKLNNTAFRKRIRRFENGQQSLRSWFQEACEFRLLPPKAIAVAALPLLDTLIREGERREVSVLSQMIQPESEMFKTLQTVNSKRAAAVMEFSEGISTGRCELSLFVARCFLKEAHRMILEARALKRQNSLLKQVGTDASSGGKKKKNKRSGQPPVGGVGPTSQSAPLQAVDATDEEGKKKKSRKKKGSSTSADKDSTTDGADEALPPTGFGVSPQENSDIQGASKHSEAARSPKPVSKSVTEPEPASTEPAELKMREEPKAASTSSMSIPDDAITARSRKPSSTAVHGGQVKCPTPSVTSHDLSGHAEMQERIITTPLEGKLPTVESAAPHVSAFTKPPSPCPVNVGRPVQVSSASAASPANCPPPNVVKGSLQSDDSLQQEPLSASSASSSVIDPLPSDLETYPTDRLIGFIRSLHEEKAHLITVVLNMQKQVSSLSTRYVELLQVARTMDEDRRTRETDQPRSQPERLQKANGNAIDISDVRTRCPARINDDDDDRHHHEYKDGDATWEKENRVSQARGSYDAAATPQPPALPPGLPASYLKTSTPSRVSASPSQAASGGAIPIRQPHIPGPTSAGFARGGARRPGRMQGQSPSVHKVRCLNCFEKGHTSAQCSSVCAWCGSADHRTAHCSA